MHGKIKYSQLTLLLPLLVLLIQLKACSCNSKNHVNSSEPGLNLQRRHSNNTLLSSQLKGKTFQDIFTDKEIRELNLVADTRIILEQDIEESIYQIRVLNQKGGTCGQHTIRNYAWLIKALNDDLNKFNEYYSLMLNEENNGKFQQSTGYNRPLSRETLSVIINKSEELLGIPEGCKKHLDEFTFIEFVFKDDNQAQKDIEIKAKEIISNLEGLDKNTIDKLARDILTIELLEEPREDLYNLALELPTKDKLIHGFNVIVGPGILHAICVVINKSKEDIEYILADSINSNFKSAYCGAYLKAVRFLKSILTNQEYFKELLVRYTYTMLCYRIESGYHEHYFFKSVEQLSKYDLRNCAFYQGIYRKHFIDLLSKHQDKFTEVDYDLFLKCF
jgi:hypothetical protein